MGSITPPEDWSLFEAESLRLWQEKRILLNINTAIAFIQKQLLPVKNDREEIFAGMVVTQDITEKKQAEIGLQEIKNQLKIKYQKRTEDSENSQQSIAGRNYLSLARRRSFAGKPGTARIVFLSIFRWLFLYDARRTGAMGQYR